jgi:hypothetical protein
MGRFWVRRRPCRESKNHYTLIVEDGDDSTLVTVYRNGECILSHSTPRSSGLPHRYRRSDC